MATHRPADLATLAGLSRLDDPVRRRLYEIVSEARAPVSREDAAVAVEISRNLAAYHLDKLVDAGLLVVGYQSSIGQGAGRPAKLYRRAERELSFSAPPRDYELLARVLARAVQADPDGAARAAVQEAAREAGQRAAKDTSAADADVDLMDSLHGCGYQPSRCADGSIELHNCPFHSVATDYLDVVCGLNLPLIEGIIEASANRAARAELEPRPGCWCVVIHDTAAQPPGQSQAERT